MKALRFIRQVDADGGLHVQVPPGMGKLFELIVLPIDADQADDGQAYSALQEQGGFVREALGATSEDVWNDL